MKKSSLLLLSGHPMDAYAGLDQAIDTFTQSEANNLDDRSPYRLCGIIANLQIKYTNKDNKQFAVFNLATGRDLRNCHVFSAFDRNRSRLENGTQALVLANQSLKWGQDSTPTKSTTYQFHSRPHRHKHHHPPGPHGILAQCGFGSAKKPTVVSSGQRTYIEVAVSFLVDGRIIENDSSKAPKYLCGENYQNLRRHPALAGLRIDHTRTGHCGDLGKKPRFLSPIKETPVDPF